MLGAENFRSFHDKPNTRFDSQAVSCRPLQSRNNCIKAPYSRESQRIKLSVLIDGWTVHPQHLIANLPNPHNHLPYLTRSMASLLLPIHRPLFSRFTFTLSSAMALGLHSHFKRRPLLCDSGPTPINAAFSSHSQDVKAPKSKNKILSPRAVRQISAGSVIGERPSFKYWLEL